MSYCRWSTDDFQCDLYVYADVMGGYTTHVAGNRPVYASPLPPVIPFEKDRLPEWMLRHQTVMEMVGAATREPIDLPYAGESFYNQDLDNCVATLRKLRDLGYRFPEHVIDAIIEDGENEADPNPY